MIKLLIFLLFVLLFHKRIKEEWSLYRRKDVIAFRERLMLSWFIPHTGKERRVLGEEFLNLLKDKQQQIAHTWVIRHIFDYRKWIQAVEQEIQEMQEREDDTALTFCTPNGSYILADPTFDEQQLLHFGASVDQHFEKEVLLEIEKKPDSIVITFCEKVEETLLQNFSQDVNEEVFRGQKVEIQATS